MHDKPERNIWRKLKRRCQNPKDTLWPKYGAKGISVCERWLDFDNFLEDMGPRPTPQHSVDRIDNTGNYQPGNCRWATIDEQLANKSNNRRVAGPDGTVKTVAQWSKETGIPYMKLYARIDRGCKQPFSQANLKRGPKLLLEFNGETRSVQEWADRFKTTYQTIYQRHYQGMPIDGSKSRGKTPILRNTGWASNTEDRPPQA